MGILGNHITRTGVKVFALCPGLTDTKLLTEAPANAINDRFAQEYADEIEGSSPQKVCIIVYYLLSSKKDCQSQHFNGCRLLV